MLIKLFRRKESGRNTLKNLEHKGAGYFLQSQKSMTLSLFKNRMKRIIIGSARNPQDPKTFHKLSLVAFTAWVGLGTDGISSSCYGPEEAFKALGHFSSFALFVALGSVFTIFIISTSYKQIIELFPGGGGG